MRCSVFRLLALAAAACLCAASLAQGYDVIVVGGGMAGMTAAQKMKAKGLSVVVLEARNRLGGRCSTETVTVNGASFPIELGASWIHGITGNPLVPLAASAGVSLASRTFNYNAGPYFGPDGKAVPAANEKR